MRRGGNIYEGAPAFGLLLILCACCCGGGVSAGPWTRAPGDTFTVLSLRYLTTEFTETSDASFRQPTINAYAEYGLREAITLGGEVEGALGLPARGAANGGGQARGFARARLWEGEEGEIISVEASMGVLAEVGETAFAQPRLSFLYGEGYEDRWYDLAASVRFKGDRPDELHSDATYGYRPAEGWVAYFQATTIQRLRPRIGEDAVVTRFGLFAGYDIATDATLVIGARREFFTVFAPPALEFSVALWTQF